MEDQKVEVLTSEDAHDVPEASALDINVPITSHEAEAVGESSAIEVDQPPLSAEYPNLVQMTDDDALQRMHAEKAVLEQQTFNISEELSNVKRQYTEVAASNAQLQEQVLSNANELNERIRLYRQLESSRDDLALKKNQAEERSEKYKKEKEERDLKIRTLTNDKHQISSELIHLKDRITELTALNAELVSGKKFWEQDRRLLTNEVQNARDDKSIFIENKKWMMKEIEDRDCRITQLRIEASNKEISWQNEKNRIMIEKDELVSKVSDLEAYLDKSSKELTEKIKAFANDMEAKQRELESAESEMHVREQIASQFKEALNNANRQIAEMQLSKTQCDEAVEQARIAMDTMTAEINEKEAEMERELSDRDGKIADLEDELLKANELIKNRHNLTMDDDDLARVAPQAAETSRLLKSGMTLTQLYREHARVIGELEEQKVMNRTLEEELRSVVDEIEQRAPELGRQKVKLDQTLDQLDQLRMQLQQADEQRRGLSQQKDAATRELAFTKVELEKYQREHNKLKQEAARLLFVLESDTRNGTDSPPLGEEEQHQLFSSIVGLQQRNIQLQMELENTKKDVQTAVESAHNAESERLRLELTSANREMEVLQLSLSKLTTAMQNIEQQRDRYKDIIDRGGLDPEANKLRKDVERLQSELNNSNGKYKLLEDHMNNIREEHVKSTRIMEDRIAQHQSVISELQQTRTRLTADMELQKQIASETKNELDKSIRDFKKQSETLEKARSAVVEADTRVANTNQTLLHKQDMISSLQIENRSLKEDLDSVRYSLARAEGELKILNETMRSNDRMITALREAGDRLQLTEDTKINRLMSQLQHTEMERDQQAVSYTNLKDQLAGIRKEMAANEVRIGGERDLARAQLADAREQLASSEKMLAELRTKLANTQAQFATVDSAIGSNPERLAKDCQQLRNRNTYLETQIEEMRSKLNEAEAEAARREHEVAQLSAMSGSMESTLKEHTVISSQESLRLQSMLKAAEQRHVELSNDLALTRQELEQRENDLRIGESNWHSEKRDLAQKLAVLEVQLADAEYGRSDANTKLADLTREAEQQLGRLAELEDSLMSLESDKVVLSSTIDQLNAQIQDKNLEIQRAASQANEETRAREIAVDNAERRLNELREKMEQQEITAKHSQEQSEGLVEQIAKLSNELAVREAATGAAGEMEMSDAGMESMNSVLRYLRDEKQLALGRSMQAEVEMKRLAAETVELRAERDRMAERVRQRDIEAEQNAAALAQRNELMIRLEGMAAAQRENVELKGDKERLSKHFEEVSVKCAELDRTLATMRVQKTQAEQKAAAAQSAADNRLRELEVFRARSNESHQEKWKQLQQEINEARQRAQQSQMDTDLARESLAEAQKKLVGADAKHADLEKRYNSVRQLAIKFRDQIKDNASKGSTQGVTNEEGSVDATGATQPGSSPNVAALNQQIVKLQEEVKQLKDTITQLEKEKNDLGKSLETERAALNVQIQALMTEKVETSVRESLMKNMMENFKAKMNKATEELDEEKKAHEATRSELMTCRTGSPQAPSSIQPAVLAVPQAPTQQSALPTSSPAVMSFKTNVIPTGTVFGSKSSMFGSKPFGQVSIPPSPSQTGSSVTMVQSAQSSSPAPSTPVASFFGLRNTSESIGQRVFSSTPTSTTASSAAPADPAPAGAPVHHAVRPIPQILDDVDTLEDVKELEQREDTVSGTDEQKESSVTLRDEDNSLSGLEGGSSQDGLPSAISSSSGLILETPAGRKRGASQMTDNEAKRLRESPGEDQITSSERNADIGEGDDLLDYETTRDAEPLIVTDDDEVDIGDDGEGEDLPAMDDLGDGEVIAIEDEDDQEVHRIDSESDEDQFDEEDEQFGDSEDRVDVMSDDSDVQEVLDDDEDDDVIEESDHDDGDEQAEDIENADIVLSSGEREASAMEEADDEGNRIESESGHHQDGGEEETDASTPSQSTSRPKRKPIVFDSTCSSSNEGGVASTGEEQPASSSRPVQVARRGRAPGISAPLYQALRVNRPAGPRGGRGGPPMAKRGVPMRGARGRK